MMKFKYNSDCSFDERIEIESQEIINEYPEISIDDAKKIAALDNPVDDKITNDDKYIRYYYIMLIIKKGHPAYFKVFEDMYNIYNNGINDEKLIDIMYEIIRYNNGERIDFPLLSEMY